MKKQFTVPGMFHPLSVTQLTDKKQNQIEEDTGVLGTYAHREAEVTVVEDLTVHVKQHTFCHEIGHHIVRSLKNMKHEEDKCDVLATFLINFAEEWPKIKKNLK